MNNSALYVPITVLATIILFCFFVCGGVHNPNNRLGKFGQTYSNEQCAKENKKLNPTIENDICAYSLYNNDTGCWLGRWDGKSTCAYSTSFDKIWAVVMCVLISLLFIMCTIFTIKLLAQSLVN